MKSHIVLGFFSLLSLAAVAQNEFKHNWNMKYLEHGIQFTSKSSAPAPYSSTGEPSALMIVDALQNDPSSKNDLTSIVKQEIENIRSSLRIEEYLEKDYRPDNNIVSYFDDFGTTKLGIIKYRTTGELTGERTMPRSVKQILFVKNNKLYVSSLIVLFAADQKNLRSDQMTFIQNVIQN